MASTRREDLINTAIVLFNREGFHATGIDRILKEAGVSRMTLYNHFKSKDELILAALRRRDETFRHGFMKNIEAIASDPKERLLAAFDVAGAWIKSDDFCGCMFTSATAEYGDCDSPIRRIAAEHKSLLLAYIQEQARGAGFKNPDALGEQICIILEGMIAIAHVSVGIGPLETADQLIDRAKQAAKIILNQAF